MFFKWAKKSQNIWTTFVIRIRHVELSKIVESHLHKMSNQLSAKIQVTLYKSKYTEETSSSRDRCNDVAAAEGMGTGHKQCDQMAILFFQNLAIQINDKLPKTINYKIVAKVGSEFCQILNSYSRNGQKFFKILPKWQNFAKSGHTGWGIRQTDKQKIGKNPFVSFREEAGGGQISLESASHLLVQYFHKSCDTEKLITGESSSRRQGWAGWERCGCGQPEKGNSRQNRLVDRERDS